MGVDCQFAQAFLILNREKMHARHLWWVSCVESASAQRGALAGSLAERGWQATAEDARSIALLLIDQVRARCAVREP